VIRILVTDDHPIVRAGLVGLLDVEDDMLIVGEAADGAEALTRLAALAPEIVDVVLMDLRMPVLDGAGATARIAAEFPSTHVLVLTTYDTDADIVRAVEAGAAGYLLKDTPRTQLVEAVRAAARGETVLAPPVAARLISRLRSPAPQPAPPENPLTPRELEVLRAVSRGLSNAEIGRELFIGEATVKTHLLRAFVKLGVDDRTRAVTAAMERGYLPPPARR
jgi:DNA-binding NarL/FixJ family response regulator